MSFLAIDVGNTRLKWALYADAAPGAALLHQGAVFLETIDSLAEGDWRDLPAPDTMLGCVVAGEAVRRRVEEQMEAWDFAPRWVVPSAGEAGISSGYEHPNRLGADRWVALVGARARVPVDALRLAPCVDRQLDEAPRARADRQQQRKRELSHGTISN